MTLYRLGISIVMISTVCIAGCSKVDNNQKFSLIQNVGTVASSKEKFEFAALLNKSPQVVIKKPKIKKKKKKKQASSNFFSGLIAGTQSRNSNGDYIKDPSIEPGPVGGSGFGNSVNQQDNENTEDAENEELFTELTQSDVVIPVAAIAYGGNKTIIKSVNGGFGMLLLKKGHHHNILACRALFKTLPVKSNSDIEVAALGYNDLFRPTYWLDQRHGPGKQKVSKTEIAANKNLLHLTNNSDQSDAKLLKTNLVSDGQQQNMGCMDKLEHYNYLVSHKLIKRLGLVGRPGPFLAAWRDDGQKAMILDLSLFNTEEAYNNAMSLWLKLIVRHTELWEPGVIKSPEFKEKIRPLFGKGKKPMVAILKPSKERSSK